MTPLYNHRDVSSAYLVPDYPYGRTLRCRIRYWLEHDRRRGFRFVSQTEKPDGTYWNAPKKSTYALIGACMYLDDARHVQWRSLNQYSSGADVLAFIRDFPLAVMSEIRQFAFVKVAHAQACVDGRMVIRINGEIKPWTEADQERHRAELAEWIEVDKMTGRPR